MAIPAIPLAGRLSGTRADGVCNWQRESGVGYSMEMELIFEVRDAEEGGYCARALGHAIFTEGDTWDDLRANVLEATSLHFEESAVRPGWFNCITLRTS